MRLASFLKDILFPRYCFSCKRLGAYICSECLNKLLPIERDVCPYCKKASFGGLTHPFCTRRGGIAGLKSLFYYNVVLKRIIEHIKYKRVTDAIDDFLQTIPPSKLDELSFFKKVAPGAGIVAIPLHPSKQRERGFNQSAFFARFFADKLEFEVMEDILVRTKDTKPQAKLASKKDRYKNTRGAFDVGREKSALLRTKDVIVVDDVWTSGSTMKEAARTLKKHKARRVFALTLAR